MAGFQNFKSEIVKHEYRNSKQIQMTKIKKTTTYRVTLFLNFEHLDFDIVSDFMLHDFVLRILPFWLRLTAMWDSLGFIDILFHGGHPCRYRFINRYFSPPFTYRHFKKNKIIS